MNSKQNESIDSTRDFERGFNINFTPCWFNSYYRQEARAYGLVSVTLDQYVESILFLLNVAKQDTPSSKSAAQVLLSLFDGYAWQLNINDLGWLDYQGLHHAIVAIQGRITVQQKPHIFIENGEAEFSELQKKWQCLHTKNRCS